MSLATTFKMNGRSFDWETRTATFSYETILVTGEIVTFNESVIFPQHLTLQPLPDGLLQQVLINLHLVLGLSYWKIHAARQIELQDISLSSKQADFWNTIYTIGMGEFFYRNRLDFRNYVSFPVNEDAPVTTFEHTLEQRSLVGIGGGKDSVVAVEGLKSEAFDITGFLVENEGQLHTNTQLMAQLNIPAVTVKRQLDPQLLTISGGYKGHIPISAIYAFLGVATGLLFNYGYVIVANEHSASEGNVQYFGSMVNHQWSKSFNFEQLFQAYIHHFISPDIHYFSLLRPLSEYRIVELFTRFPAYFPHFTSCNRNFRMSGDTPKRWCGECPKCAFAYAMFAAFLPKATIIEIFGSNFFEDTSLIPLYRELLGIENFKPWDCVGTPDEVKYALFKAKERGEFTDTPVMRMFEEELEQHGLPVSVIAEHLERQQNEHAIPGPFLPVLKHL